MNLNRISLSLTSKLYYLILTFIIVWSSANADLDPCEIYFEESLTTIKCVDGNQFDHSLIPESDVLSNSCDRESSTDSGSKTLSQVTVAISERCFVRPSLFGFLNLPNVEYFYSEQNGSFSVLFNNSFEGLCSLRDITLTNSGIESIESAAFDCLNSLKYLDLSYNRIESLSSDVFKGMHQLKDLILKRNRIFKLPKGIFENLISLETLDLESNYISWLPGDIFWHQTSLLHLIITGNGLSDLNAHIFSNMTELENLELAYNELTNLTGLFSRNSKLRYLNIGNNEGLVLNNQTFFGLTAMETLNMEHCGISLLPSNLFAHNVKLSFVELRGNNLQEISSKVFSTLPHLKELHLNDCNIDKLIGRPFANSRLQTLDLNSNRLSSIIYENFEGLSLLTHLDLSSNAIESLEGRSLDHMENLKPLNQGSHRILSLYESSQSLFSNLRQLRYLYLSNNNLKRLTNIFVNNSNLTHLVLSWNTELKLDNNSFTGLFKLKYLHMEACNIEVLPNALFKDTHELLSLHMPNNRLTEINSDAFGTLKVLYSLNLGFNNITTLRNKPFVHNGNIEYLNLANNNLSEIKTDDFVGLSELMSLDLSWNFIQNISDKSFYNVPKLALLDISHNVISSIKGSDPFQHNTELELVDVSYNLLADISNIKLSNMEEFRATDNDIKELYLSEEMSRISEIHLERNNVHRIHIVPSVANEKELSSLAQKTKIYLTGNALQCDCHAYEFYRYMKGHTTRRMEFVDGLHCQLPVALRGRQLNSLDPRDFSCNITDFCPRNCSCSFTAHNGIQTVNCSNKDYVKFPNQAPLNTNILFMNGNNLTSLVYLNDTLWENLTSLHVENNDVDDDKFYIPKNLKFLGLKGNKLKTLPFAVRKHADVVKDFKITLSNNGWPCDCSVASFKQWLLQHVTQVIDVNEVRCTFLSSSTSTIGLIEMQHTELCPEIGTMLPSTTVYVIPVTFVLFGTLIALLHYIYKFEAVSFYFTHCNKLFTALTRIAVVEKGKTFDCFLSYGSADREIGFAILEELENKRPCFKVCIHERNWVPGHFITDNILNSVQKSRKTVIILSRTFLKSEWFRMEFQAACLQSLNDGKDRLIFVLTEKELQNSSELDTDVQFFLSSKTYLLWGEKWFWEKLRYSIQTQKCFRGRENRPGFRGIIRRILRKDEQYRTPAFLNRNCCDPDQLEETQINSVYI